MKHLTLKRLLCLVLLFAYPSFAYAGFEDLTGWVEENMKIIGGIGLAICIGAIVIKQLFKIDFLAGLLAAYAGKLFIGLVLVAVFFIIKDDLAGPIGFFQDPVGTFLGAF